ncbi:electron transfer flavoprotein subunit beta/FixA family protein [Natronospora cellulosivora (SeqCode)]
MHIIVLVKQVPEMEKVKFDTEKGVINRKSAGVEINPFDLNALETAVKIKEEIGAKVTALTMGPKRAEDVLREAVSRGADEGILLSDKKFAGSDTVATSTILAAAIKKIEDYDLVIAGEMTVDGDTAQVGPQTAEFLLVPHVSYVSELCEINEDELEIACNVWNATYKKKVSFPALITVTKDINTPRLPSFKDKMRSRKAEIEEWDYDKLKEELDSDLIGIKGSPTRVKKIVVPKSNIREGKAWRDEQISQGLQEIVSMCKEKRIIGGGEDG